MAPSPTLSALGGPAVPLAGDAVGRAAVLAEAIRVNPRCCPTEPRAQARGRPHPSLALWALIEALTMLLFSYYTLVYISSRPLALPAASARFFVLAMPAILHLDADAFFASLEQRDDRSLRGKPVAVGSGVVASCSYEARQWGVRTGMRLTDARHLCRPLIVVPGDYRRYEQAARCMLAICQERTPRVEVAALDDLYLDLTPNDDPEKVAATLHEQVRDEISLHISVGIGANKMVAQVATDDAKQRKLQLLQSRSRLSADSAFVCVEGGTEREYLAPWPARVLPAVGPKVGGRLERLNVN